MCGKDKPWQAFGNSCYLFVEQWLNWNAARSHCLKMDADLVSLTTEDEINFICSRAKNLGWGFWIGLRYSSSTWTWSNGEKVNITKWGEKEPTNLRYKQCGEIVKKSKRWDNKKCDRKRALICEKAKTYPVSNPVNQNSTTAGI